LPPSFPILPRSTYEYVPGSLPPLYLRNVEGPIPDHFMTLRPPSSLRPLFTTSLFPHLIWKALKFIAKAIVLTPDSSPFRLTPFSSPESILEILLAAFTPSFLGRMRFFMSPPLKQPVLFSSPSLHSPAVKPPSFEWLSLCQLLTSFFLFWHEVPCFY